jgi:hypothetical protein
MVDWTDDEEIRHIIGGGGGGDYMENIYLWTCMDKHVSSKTCNLPLLAYFVNLQIHNF